MTDLLSKFDQIDTTHNFAPLTKPSQVLTIPILLLWGVQISLHRKLALGTILCLSVFTMIICIIRISGGNTVNGQIDTAWVIFWLQVEASL